MAATDFFTGFGYKWAQDGSIYNWDDTQYKQGWATIGSVPPSVEQFNRIQQISDEKANWLYGQLQAAATAKGVTLASGDLTGLLQTLAAYTVDAQSQKYNYAVGTGTANAIVAALSPAPTVLAAGMPVRVKIATTNTGASTLNLNGLGATAINGLAGSALQGGELFANGLATFVYSGSVWILLGCQGGALPVAPATKSNQAVNLGQFSSLPGANGYTYLPNGIMLQWQQFTPATNPQTVFFPVSFPTTSFQCVGTQRNGSTPTVPMDVYPINSSQFSIRTGIQANVAVFSIGH